MNVRICGENYEYMLELKKFLTEEDDNLEEQNIHYISDKKLKSKSETIRMDLSLLIISSEKYMEQYKYFSGKFKNSGEKIALVYDIVPLYKSLKFSESHKKYIKNYFEKEVPILFYPFTTNISTLDKSEKKIYNKIIEEFENNIDLLLNINNFCCDIL